MNIFYIVPAIFGLTILGSIYMLIRNDWVYRNRIRLLYKDWDAYDRLPSYDSMWLRFWVWDINKFIQP